MEIARAIRRALTDAIGEDRYDVWFAQRASLTVTGRVLHVTVVNQFLLDRLRKDFAGILQSLAQRMLGTAGAVEYRLGDVDNSSANESADKGESNSVTEASLRQPPSADRRQSTDRRDTRSPNYNIHRLDNFVVSEGTQVAMTSAQIVLDRPGQCTPMFIYGPSGCGKTHLLEGIRREAATRTHRVVLLSSEQFTSEFLAALHGSGLPNFRRRYRDVQMLLLDDVQFFANKAATLVELQHTLDSLISQRRQIVLAADRSPAELAGLGPELVTRMAGGLVSGMEHPHHQARVAILSGVFTELGLQVDAAVVNFVASQISGDARQLRGAAHRLLATSEATRRPVTIDLAEEALADVIRATCRAVRLKDIESAVCDVFGLRPEDLQSGRRSRAVSQPRMLAMWLARKHTRAAFSEIGHFFGGRSHSTVISASKKVTGWVSDGSAIQVAHGECPIDDAIRRIETRLRA